MTDEEKELILESIRNDVALVGKALKTISEKVVEEGISEYPLFIASQEYVDIGKPVFDRDSVQLNWFFNASILEDFTQKRLITPDKAANFTRTFGDPSEKACIFVIKGGEAFFVFVPYDPDQEEMKENGKDVT
ncbi:MAG: hypothetical protein R8P61_26590 [Bacteroidia bacterium]|nr:hypothetical protein [Bacteroidia bacterium]